MVVSEAKRVRARKDKAPNIDISAPPMVEDASESSQASPRAPCTSLPMHDAYVTMDVLKSLMSVEAAGSTRPVHGEETSHQPEGMPSLRPVESGRKGTRVDRNERPLNGRQGSKQRRNSSLDPHGGEQHSRQPPLPPT